MRAAIVLLLR